MCPSHIEYSWHIGGIVSINDVIRLFSVPLSFTVHRPFWAPTSDECHLVFDRTGTRMFLLHMYQGRKLLVCSHTTHTPPPFFHLTPYRHIIHENVPFKTDEKWLFRVGVPLVISLPPQTRLGDPYSSSTGPPSSCPLSSWIIVLSSSTSSSLFDEIRGPTQNFPVGTSPGTFYLFLLPEMKNYSFQI